MFHHVSKPQKLSTSFMNHFIINNAWKTTRGHVDLAFDS